MKPGLIAVAWFSSLPTRVTTIASSELRSRLFGPTELGASILTVIASSSIHVVQNENDCGNNSESHIELFPVLWSDASITRTLLEYAARFTPIPEYWIVGSYEAAVMTHDGRMRCTEIAALANHGFLSRAIADQLCATIRGHATVIYRTNRIDEIIFPETQGYGHFEGARIAVWRANDESDAAYKAWESEILQCSKNSEPIRLGDLCAPVGCEAWVSPFGVERREAAVVAQVEQTPREIATRFARALRLPMIEVPCSEEEWRMWEWAGVPPRSMRTYLEERGIPYEK